MEKLCDRIERISNHRVVKRICAFVDSPLFAVSFGAIALLLYCLRLPLLFLAILFACVSWICLFSRDTRSGIALILFYAITRTNKYNHGAYTSGIAFALYGTLGLFAIACMFYRMTMRRARWQGKSGLFGIVCFASAFLIGGVFSKYYSLHNFTYALSMAGYILCIYIFFGLTLEKREDNVLYLARVCAIAVAIIVLEVLEFYLRHYESGMKLNDPWKGKLIIGWTFSNSIGEMIAFLLPAVYYLIYKEKYGYLYYFLIGVAAFGVYFTLGRNALLWTGIVLFFGTGINCFIGRNKKINRIVVFMALLIACGIGIWLIAKGNIQSVVTFFKDVGFDDRARFRIWENHLHLFAESPLNGIGFKSYETIASSVSKAHNIFVQIVSSSGLIGLGLYLTHRAQTIYSIVKKPTAGRLFIGSCILVSLGIGILSSAFFHNYSIIYYTVMLIVIEKS